MVTTSAPGLSFWVKGLGRNWLTSLSRVEVPALGPARQNISDVSSPGASNQAAKTERQLAHLAGESEDFALFWCHLKGYVFRDTYLAIFVVELLVDRDHPDIV